MKPRVAIYGGSFDPFHYGHLVPTIRAQETFEFDAVYFVPAGKPPHKEGEPLTPVTHRFAMVALATLPHRGFFTSDIEVGAQGPTYTVDTVRRFRQKFGNAALYFLMGSDSFSQIATWDRWEELIEICHLVVLHRAHMWGDELRARIPEGTAERIVEVAPFSRVADPEKQTIYLLDHEPFPISATSIRDRQREGVPIRELVPHEVFSYIEKYRLYRREEEDDSRADGR
ncbi:MAG: nicotinate (nicotinamide) nucleotide adenylyltransferase [bacterium]|nr:nicotinate (nicotinamide) nucleotide adenylyltransferase [bacterium]